MDLPFDPIDDLANADAERLRAAVRGGPAPLQAAAELARRGDVGAARVVAMAVAFAEPADVTALAATDDVAVSDGLAAGVLGALLPAPLREACAVALGDAAVTPASLAALGEVADGSKRPPWSQAARALASASARSGASARAEAERVRAAARQLRAGEGGAGRRQAFQRDLARGAVPAVLGLMLHPDLLANVVPPVADEAAAGLVPVALVAARSAPEGLRPKLLALVQRRWGTSAGSALSCAVRAPARPKDDGLRVALVAGLGAMGRHDALAACAAVCAGAVRAAALGELARAMARGPVEVPAGWFEEALARAVRDPDPAARAAAERVAPRR